MTSVRAFRIASRLGLATTLLMLGLIVVGSVVRTTLVGHQPVEMPRLPD